MNIAASVIAPKARAPIPAASGLLVIALGSSVCIVAPSGLRGCDHAKPVAVTRLRPRGWIVAGIGWIFGRCGVDDRMSPLRLADESRQMAAVPGRLLRIGFDQARLVCEHDRLYAVAQSQLLQRVGDVRLHGRLADHKLPGDLG